MLRGFFLRLALLRLTGSPKPRAKLATSRRLPNRSMRNVPPRPMSRRSEFGLRPKRLSSSAEPRPTRQRRRFWPAPRPKPSRRAPKDRANASWPTPMRLGLFVKLNSLADRSLRISRGAGQRLDVRLNSSVRVASACSHLTRLSAVPSTRFPKNSRFRCRRLVLRPRPLAIRCRRRPSRSSKKKSRPPA